MFHSKTKIPWNLTLYINLHWRRIWWKRQNYCFVYKYDPTFYYKFCHIFLWIYTSIYVNFSYVILFYSIRKYFKQKDYGASELHALLYVSQRSTLHYEFIKFGKDVLSLLWPKYIFIYLFIPLSISAFYVRQYASII